MNYCRDAACCVSTNNILFIVFYETGNSFIPQNPMKHETSLAGGFPEGSCQGRW